MGNVLVVYSLMQHPLRESVSDHLLAFRRYSPRRVFHLNLAVRRVPGWARRVDFDMVVFHTTFLSKRATPDYWKLMVERARPLRDIGRVRVALPQDEYLPPGRLVGFVNEFDVGHVFSVAPESEWPVIYEGVDRSRVQLHRVLTGYVEPRALERVDAVGGGAGRARDLDIGYRAKDLPFWLGRHARLKAELADAVASAAPRHGLSVDVSTRAEDTLLGEDWLRFLLRCKYTIGAEGGASLLDPDGSVRERVERYLRDHPDASFEDVERECFPGLDGGFGLVAISPRHLEACATRTCQALVEGDYNGVLEAGRHYLPLQPDLSNLDEVLDEMRRDERREEIVEAAWQDVVASGRFTYQRFVEEVEGAVLDPGTPASADGRSGSNSGRAERLAYGWARLVERLSWLEVWLRLRVGPLLRRG